MYKVECYYSKHCICILSGLDDPRMSAEEMDERRKENLAYEYLCHLEEAKVYALMSYCFVFI